MVGYQQATIIRGLQSGARFMQLGNSATSPRLRYITFRQNGMENWSKYFKLPILRGNDKIGIQIVKTYLYVIVPEFSIIYVFLWTDADLLASRSSSTVNLM